MIPTFENIINELSPKYLEMLNSNKLLRERPDFHPEESAFEHIKIVYDRLYPLGKPSLIFTALFHDITKHKDHVIGKTGYPTSLDHDKHGAEIAGENSDLIQKYGGVVEDVVWLCSQHMRAKLVDEMRNKKKNELITHPLWDTLRIFLKADDMLTPFEL